MNRSFANMLLATNPAYWPSVGGSEMVLQKILEGVAPQFERVVVFTESAAEPGKHNGIEICPYDSRALRRFAKQYRPRTYFPNMVHSRLTIENIDYVSRFCEKTIVNMIGGYEPNTPLKIRLRNLDLVARNSTAAVHVDPLGTEFFIDRAMNPAIPFKFIRQGLDFSELDEAKKRAEEIRSDYYVYAHNLWSWKEPDVFINRIVARMPYQKFVILADDKSGDCIEKTLGLAKACQNLTVYLGRPRQEFLTRLAGALGVVSTSRVEGAQPNILLESGYLGVPYLSLCPGQNFGHYPHVEMYNSPEDIAARIEAAGSSILKEKASELRRANRLLSGTVYAWDHVIAEFARLLT